MNEEAKKVFIPGPMISLHSAWKLSSDLVRGKLYPIEQTVGWFKCSGKRCQTCLNVNKMDTSTTTGEKYKINHQFNCNCKCLVYLLTCKVCLKQYVGQTAEEFRLTWNNSKSNDLKCQKLEPYMQQHLFEHFNGEGHHCFLDKIFIIFTDPSEPSKRENYWSSIIIKTMAPWVLNAEDGVWAQFKDTILYVSISLKFNCTVMDGLLSIDYVI